MIVRLSDIREWSRGAWVNEQALSPDTREVLQNIELGGLASLRRAEEGTVSFFFSVEFQGDLPSTKPSVLITGHPFVQALEQSGLPLWKNSAVVACDDPYLALGILSEKFYSTDRGPTPHRVAEKTVRIHPTAVVGPDVQLGSGVEVGPYSVIGAGTVIGDGTHIDSHVSIGKNSRIGAHGRVFPHVSLYDHVTIGDRVRIHSGTVIGSDGFGYAPIYDGARQVVGHQKIYHSGGVVVGNDVEFGANVCVDQGTLDPTVIGDACKIDNDVHIGHNCKLGTGVIMCGMSGLAGGTELGDFCYIGGLSGIGERAKIGARAMVGANSQVAKDIAAGARVVGNPLRSFEDHFRAHATLNRLLKTKRLSKTQAKTQAKGKP